MGSGSTGKACAREGFQFIGIELEPEYMAISRARIEHEQSVVACAAAVLPTPQLDLFNEIEKAS
jgi:site-specific DNA-methyltransferase (adenine-specific)